jgi:hypothetical protein
MSFYQDAFTGCQILPCSHKVHKECVNQLKKGETYVYISFCVLFASD